MSTQTCPCGSGKSYSDCCGRYIDGGETPATAEALMRSRYTAYALGNGEYVLQSWHPDTRPEGEVCDPQVKWLGLAIRNAKGGAGDDEGTVEFLARFKVNGRAGRMHERSHFKREDGRWYYLDGEMLDTPAADTPGRNAPCPCGSGKKYKRCCGA